MTASYNTGNVENSGNASIVALGGLTGWSNACSYATVCYNTGVLSNSGVGSDATAGVRMGGLVGFATGVNNFAGTSSSVNNYNNAAIVETSSSAAIAVGGAVGYADNASTNLAFCQNKADGDIMLGEDDADHTHNQVYVGGVLACTSASTQFNYASNAGDIVFNRLNISGQVFAGGVHGAFTTSGTQTITGCVNSGTIKTKTESDNAHLITDSTTPSLKWSFIGGVSAVGCADMTQEKFAFGDMYKTFQNCSNEGAISIFSQLRTCVGGVLAWSDVCPTVTTGNMTSCTANVRFKKVGGKVHDSYRSICGGVVGYCPVATLSDMKYYGELNSNGCERFAYTGSIVGLTTAGTAFSNCKIGGSVRAANSNDGQSGLFCNANGNYNYSFSNCIVRSGTIIKNSSANFTVTDATIGDLTIALCCRRNGSPTNTDGSLSTEFSVGSID